MTPEDIAALLRELHALETIQAVILARTDTPDAYTWQCVVTAIRERRARLIAYGEAVLSATSTDPPAVDVTTPTADVDVPFGRVH